MTNSYPPDPTPSYRLLEARLHLMDRQILDVDTVPVSAVDDIEFTDPSDGPRLPTGGPAPIITNLITGLRLETRLFGGRPPDRLLHRIAWSDVRSMGTAVDLAVSGEKLEATWLERWTRDNVIARIPGGAHVPQ